MRCDYKTGMFAAEEPEWFFDGPYFRARGNLASTCVHEAAHIVTMYGLGGRPGSVSVSTYYRAGPDGITWAANSGRSFPWVPPGKIARTYEDCPSVPVPREVRDAIVCWRPFIRNVMVACAGHGSELKYCRANGLRFMARSRSDRSDCEYESRLCWALAGRDGSALLRLAWRETQRMLEIPEVWKAIGAVEAALFSGLLWREPPDPRAGDEVSFALEGHEAEALIEGTGLRCGQFWQEHRCSPQCVRSRPISRAFRATVEAWASESLKPETAKEM
jgi:hypothetical protein